MPLELQMRAMSIEEDPLREVLQLEQPKAQDMYAKTSYGDILQSNERMQLFLGLGP